MLLGGLFTTVVMGFGHPILGTLWGVTLFWALLGLVAATDRWHVVPPSVPGISRVQKQGEEGTLWV